MLLTVKVVVMCEMGIVVDEVGPDTGSRLYMSPKCGVKGNVHGYIHLVVYSTMYMGIHHTT
jgi:hypothetical protein